MCKDKIDVEIIGLKQEDIIIFFVDNDYYDLNNLPKVAEMLQSYFPKNKIAILPKDMVNEIKIFTSNELMEIDQRDIAEIDWSKMSRNFIEEI